MPTLFEEMYKETIPGGGQHRLAAQPNLAAVAPPAPEGRSFGFRSGANQPGGTAQRNLAGAAYRGAELGEPTSFAGGAGAPEPIAVMRGTTTTYAGGRPEGAQFVLPEVATPVQARQAWNREQANLATAAADRRRLTDPSIPARFGEWRAPGQTLEEVRITKEPPSHGEAWRAEAEQRRQAAAKTKREEAEAQKKLIGASFISEAKKMWGTPTVGKGGLAEYTLPKDEHLLRDIDEANLYAQEQGNIKAGHDYMEWSKRLRQMYPDVYATAMRENPLAWKEVVITHGPQLPATGQISRPAQPQGIASWRLPTEVKPPLEEPPLGP